MILETKHYLSTSSYHLFPSIFPTHAISCYYIAKGKIDTVRLYMYCRRKEISAAGTNNALQIGGIVLFES